MAASAPRRVGARPKVSVVMPTFEQAAFIPRAVASLRRQTEPSWELIVVDDGSADATAGALERLAADGRVRAVRHNRNEGLGAACNTALDIARGEYVAYLPSDDLFDHDHLATLLATLADRRVHAAASGVRSEEEPCGIQLVQVMHRRTPERWLQRDELETDDLARLFWDRIGPLEDTGRTTCTWTAHPDQRHRRIRATLDGGLNPFRRRYGIQRPLRFHSSDGDEIDERGICDRLRRPTGRAADGLRIAIVGELGFNAERVVALEERGHELHGLWIDDPLANSGVGPLPFGNVSEVPPDRWPTALRDIRPDVVYGLLNWRAAPLVHAVMEASVGAPLVWHFKEAPQRSIVRGDWPVLADLHARADAVIYATEAERDWFAHALPDRRRPAATHVLDGDLPIAEWFAADPHRRLGEDDGAIHTVSLGRPVGLDAEALLTLARANVHTHLYGLVRQPGPGGRWTSWLREAVASAPSHVHIHPRVEPHRWVAELSRYDAGWMHRFSSDNGGDLGRATWDDLNAPARLPVYLAAGVPLLQQSNPGARVHVQDLVDDLGIGILYDDLEDLVDRLRDSVASERPHPAVAGHRQQFTFDAHVESLTDIFRTVVR